MKIKSKVKKLADPPPPLLRKVRHFDCGKISPTSATNGVLAQKMVKNGPKCAKKGPKWAKNKLRRT